MLRAAIVGAPGYAGVELTRLLLAHPGFELVMVTSGAEAGRGVTDVYPGLAGLTDLSYLTPDVSHIAHEAEIVFLAVPHTAALELAPALLDAGLTVIDASADYRLADPEIYERWYGVAHSSPGLLADAVYGLPEIDRSRLPGARLIACPGCYPTATLLAAAPALEAGICAPGPVIVDAKSGVSGAGKSLSPATHYASVNEAIAPYKVGAHRHTPEIEQGLSIIAGRAVHVVFSPHLVPMTRGLLATVYLPLASPGGSTQEMVRLFRGYYEDEPFITVHDAGRWPSTGEVRGSNRAHIGLTVDDAGMLVVACAIDNLVKGTSGQALQCANIASGYEETTGLLIPVPVV